MRQSYLQVNKKDHEPIEKCIQKSLLQWKTDTNKTIASINPLFPLLGLMIHFWLKELNIE